MMTMLTRNTFKLLVFNYNNADNGNGTGRSAATTPVLENTSVGVIEISIDKTTQINETKMRRKFNSDEERRAARIIQNREAQQRSRAKIKLKPKPIKALSTVPVSTASSYNNDLYTGCSGYPFSHLITLTNEKLVTLNMHNKTVDGLINWLVECGYISNYIKTNEYSGGNFHAHVLVQLNAWGENLKDLLKTKWGNGFYRVDRIQSDAHRLNAIRYCFKQIDVTSYRDLMQSLADSWSISLTQTFEALKKAESDRLQAFKVANGLTLQIKNILPKNRLPTWK